MHRRDFLAGALPGFGAYLAFRSEARAQGTSRAPRLKISAIKAARLRGINSKFVRVYTDQGLTGDGETLDTVGAQDIINNHLGPALVGRDPLDIEGIWFDLWSWKSPPGGIPPVFMRGMGGPYLAALSGIEMALWDLAGKAMGVPLYRLFGGRVRNKVAVYYHAGQPSEALKIVRSTGVKAIKTGIDNITQKDNPERGFDPGKSWNFTLTNRQIDDIASFVGSMREALGPELGLALECHTRYDTESAIQIAKAVERYRPMWFEEPVPSDNVEAMVAVRRSTRIPIAAGENIYTRYGFREYLEKQAVSIIQPDMAKCGGLWESRKIAAMAEVYHIPIAPHGVASTLGKVAYAHVCSTVPNFMILEWAHLYNEPLNRLMEPARQESGFVHVPDAPGIGIKLNDAAIRESLEPGYEFK
ncbi:MAG: D-galactonate dehydratase [Bryobacteraceae bacterium]|nr:D-galactonate dehydratase [Bryobacteraceae bacterium]